MLGIILLWSTKSVEIHSNWAMVIFSFPVICFTFFCLVAPFLAVPIALLKRPLEWDSFTNLPVAFLCLELTLVLWTRLRPSLLSQLGQLLLQSQAGSGFSLIQIYNQHSGFNHQCALPLSHNAEVKLPADKNAQASNCQTEAEEKIGSSLISFAWVWWADFLHSPLAPLRALTVPLLVLVALSYLLLSSIRPVSVWHRDSK